MSLPRPSILEAARAYRRLAPYSRPHRRAMGRAAAVTFLVIAAELLRPWPIKLVLDQVILGQPLNGLPQLLSGEDGRTLLLWASCAALLVIAALGGVAQYVRTIIVARAGNRMVAHIRSDLHDRIVRMSLSYHSRQRKGDLLVRLTGDAAMLSTLLIEGVMLLAQELLLMFGIAVVALTLNPRMTLVALLTMPIVTGVVLHYGGRLRSAAQRQRRKEGAIATSAAESLLAVPEIQAYGLEQRAGEFFEKQARKSGKAAVAAARLEGQMARATDVAIAVGTAVVLLVGADQVLRGQLSPGGMLVFVSYIRTMFKPMRKISARSAKLLKASAGGERLMEILDLDSDIHEPEQPIQLPAVRGDVRFSRVSYSYDHDGPEVLADVDLHILPGECVAVLGPNGAGKSTLISLLARLRDPRTGSVLVDGHDVRSMRLSDLRRQVALVFQRTVLFDGTIEDNVRMGRPDATDAEVATALEQSGVSEFAAELPNGVGTSVGEIGDSLSGGQRQRVALARALLRDARVLIFDEPTTGLDPSAVAKLRDQVLPSLSDRTVLLVTHDRRLALTADRAIVLSRGTVVFDGLPGGAIALMADESSPSMDVDTLRMGRGA